MGTKPYRRVIRCVVVVGVFLAAGCAVMTIDVDVYKGSLANHREVQMEQMAAMAIASKTLLVELRDNVHVQDCVREIRWFLVEETLKDEMNRKLKRFRSCEAYRADYMLTSWADPCEPPRSVEWGRDRDQGKQDCDPGHWEGFFNNTYAYNVNDILSLYKDRLSTQILKLTDSLTTDLESYRRVFLDVYDTTGDPNDVIAWLSDPTGADELRTAYKEFFRSAQREPRQIMEVLDRSRGSAATVPNEAYDVLVQREVVEGHANAMNMPEQYRQVFVDRVTTISRSYLQARSLLERLWMTSMEAILYVHTADDPAFSYPSARRRVSDEFVDLSLELIQPRYIAARCEFLGARDTTFLSSSLDSLGYPKALPEWDPNTYETAKRILRQLFSDQPTRTAQELLSWQREAKEFDPQEITESRLRQVPEYLRFDSGWWFGLVRAPFAIDEVVSYGYIHSDKPIRPERLVEHVRSAYGYLERRAFGRGRRDEGLETLVEKYLRESSYSPDSDKTKRARADLFVELVRFAEKLRFLGNYAGLLDDPTDSEHGIAGGLFDASRRGLVGSRVFRENGAAKYVRLLQTVGNSILVQADALTQEKDFNQRLSDPNRIHLEALRQALGSSSTLKWAADLDKEATSQLDSLPKRQQVLTHERDELRAAQTAATEKRKQLLTQIDLSDAKPPYEEQMKLRNRNLDAAHAILVAEKGDAKTWAREHKLALEALQAAINESTDKSASSVYKGLAGKLNEIGNRVSSDSLRSAAAYFEQKAGPTSAGTLKPDMDDVKHMIENEKEQALQLLALARQADTTAQEIDQCTKRMKELDDQMKEAETTTNGIELVQTALKEVQAVDAGQPAAADTGSLTARQLFTKLVANLDQRQGAESSCKAKAVEFVRTKEPVDTPVVAERLLDERFLPKDYTAKDVRDMWITLLEYEHDLALRNGMSERAKQLDAALVAARSKRQAQIFLRPAMSYLRTSFPSTSLQDNPSLTWDNQLGIQAAKSIPFGPEFADFLNPDAKRDARITAEIDKQFWQNINRVRVAGGGITNYVVAKDDIGNWYVKGYSADPKPIIRSAQNLALYSMGAKMGADLLSTLPAGTDTKGTNKAATQTPRAQVLYEQYRKDYEAKTGEQLDALAQRVDSDTLKDEIAAAWGGGDLLQPHRETFNQKLNDSYRLLKEDLKRIRADDKTAADERIVKLVERIGVAQAQLTSAVGAIPFTQEIAAQEQQARQTMIEKQQAMDEARLAHEDALRVPPGSNSFEKQRADVEAKRTLYLQAQRAYEEAKTGYERTQAQRKSVENAAKALRVEVGRAFQKVRGDALEARRRQIREYETRLHLLGDVTGLEAPVAGGKK